MKRLLFQVRWWRWFLFGFTTKCEGRAEFERWLEREPKENLL